MTGQVYQAFVEAGLEKEARQLSTTIEGKVVPALGHYIATVDNILDLEKQFPYRAQSIERLKIANFYDFCINKIREYFPTHGLIKPESADLRVCQEYTTTPQIASLLETLNKIFCSKIK